MNSENLLVRVLLRPNGNVHIAFRDRETIFATPKNLFELLSDPIDFIEERRHTYETSITEGNRRSCSLDRIPGLTLAAITTDKRLVCDFPELFRYVFSSDLSAEDKTTKLNMQNFEFEEILSDEKSYLLRYYLEFTNSFVNTTKIRHNIHLRNDVQSAIVGEILNTFFEDAVPTAAKADLAVKIEESSGLKVYNRQEEDQWVSPARYGQMYNNLTRHTIMKYIKKNAVEYKCTSSGRYLVNASIPPAFTDLRKGRKTGVNVPEVMSLYKPGTSAKEVEEYILEKGYFSKKIAEWIQTKKELDFYIKNHYREIVLRGRNTLVIDVNPDYIGSSKLSNRELMKKGHAPVIFDKEKGEDLSYHLHHVGQRRNSPLAIISDYDHLRGEYSSYFHQTRSAPDGNLHDAQFKTDSANYWKAYIEEYDKAEGFYKIKTVKTSPAKSKNKE
ncbi:MAG: hypothetical protein IJP35_03750 [Clostridia bacterium]|nr:hypothetical protein [Clostridia bacterium]